MKSLRLIAISAIAVLAAGCGGGGGGSSDAPVTTYKLAVPAVNSQTMYGQTTIDNSNNTISQTVRNTITAVNVDGSYVYTRDDPNQSSPVVNGTSYAIVTMSITADGAGHMQSYSVTSGTPVTCTESPHGPGPTYPVRIGGTWSLDFTITCGNAAPVAYSESGSVSAVESVTLPAGTFSAVRFDSTLVHTNAKGTTLTESATMWREVNTGRLVKNIDVIRYSGTVPTTGYPVSITSELQTP